jgi:hypothetical protein
MLINMSQHSVMQFFLQTIPRPQNTDIHSLALPTTCIAPYIVHYLLIELRFLSAKIDIPILDPIDYPVNGIIAWYDLRF